MAKEKSEKVVAVRLLVDTNIDGTIYPCNTVFECDAATAKNLCNAGVADDHHACHSMILYARISSTNWSNRYAASCGPGAASG